MSKAKLIVIQPGSSAQELEFQGQVVSIGRALDNTIVVESDSNVSRYHAEIVARDGGYWVSDLGSSNGTSLNGQPVEFEQRLKDGDSISVGGTTTIEFRLEQTRSQPEVEEEYEEEESAAVVAAPQVRSAAARTPRVTAPAARGPSPLLIIAAVGGGLILTGIVAFILISKFGGGCRATVRVVSPQSGETLRMPTVVRVEAEETKCIDRVVYQMDGHEFAVAEAAPYEVVLDPAQFSSGENHMLSVVVEDQEGNKKVQGETVLLAFASSSGAGSGQTAGTTGGTTQQTEAPPLPPPPNAGSIDIGAMSERLAAQITSKSGYVFSRDFEDLIRVRTNEYRLNGFDERARRYRREINKAFHDQGLDPLVGYVLAMSRSKFNENATGEGVGLWQLPISVVRDQGYLAAGETEAALKDPKRSAEIAAAYTKAVFSTFDTDDFMYAIACYGMPLNQVGQVRTQLATAAPDPMARRDFMKMVKSGIIKGEQVDRVVRFFAAGIVGENPQAFGLSGTQPFDTLF
ncbi:MAG TPA: FHA domain-containing protein [Pyrinomonadaceae bacterium]|nr:FHA domain-containing protein [Pyrinomonadaceae bacterium]